MSSVEEFFKNRITFTEEKSYTILFFHLVQGIVLMSLNIKVK